MHKWAHRKSGDSLINALLILDVYEVQSSEMLRICGLSGSVEDVEEYRHRFICEVPLVIAALMHLKFYWVVLSIYLCEHALRWTVIVVE